MWQGVTILIGCSFFSDEWIGGDCKSFGGGGWSGVAQVALSDERQERSDVGARELIFNFLVFDEF